MIKTQKRETRFERRRLRKANKQKVKGLHGRIKHVIGNFRLSLTFRIALHYTWQLLRTTLLVMAIISLVLGALTAIDGIRRARVILF